jgi:hypothetical protein
VAGLVWRNLGGSSIATKGIAGPLGFPSQMVFVRVLIGRSVLRIILRSEKSWKRCGIGPYGDVHPDLQQYAAKEGEEEVRKCPDGWLSGPLCRIICWSRPLRSSTCRALDFARYVWGRAAFDLGAWGPDSPDASLLLGVLGLDFDYLDAWYRAEGLALQFSYRP